MGDLASFGVQKLLELLSQEYEHFWGVEDQVSELKTDLLTLKSFLKDADAKKHTSALVKTYVEHIKEIIYDAEDILETFILTDKLGETSGIKSCVRRLACIIRERRGIALEMKGISKRISKVIGDMNSFGVQQIVSNGGSIVQPLPDRQRAMRETFSNEYESDLVGLEENIKKLIELMVDEEKVQVVSVTGMGGVGKTTLARQVFNHEKVKHHFDGLAWVCVSQEFTREYVWQTILQNLTPKEDQKNVLKMRGHQLQSELYQLLETSKSLIVLDDIWKEDDWELIKKIFPAKNGSKVILTSRNKSVAGHSDTKHINFQSECLSDENSWTLLEKIAFPRKDASEIKVDEEMENMGKQMLRHCGGLPLAVKVLGGLLAANYTLRDWKRISEGIGSRILEGTNSKDNHNASVDYVLSLSFEELPIYLKHCFLYLSHFQEDHTIDVEVLSYYWAAEEIPKPRFHNEESIRDVGDSCIEELVSRNMVIAERKKSSLRFETCHLHDMMREVCLSKAKEENFLQIFGIDSPTLNSQSRNTSRRLVLQKPTILNAERDLNSPKLRSLLIIVKVGHMHGNYMLPCSSFTKLQLLRVLDLSRVEFEGGELPSGIGKLIHLRYLSLYDTNVLHLPSSLRNLKLLIYLNIDTDRSKMFVPNFLMEMQELRYLALPSLMHEKTKLKLGNLVNLETLWNFSTGSSSLKDLHGMVRLRNLSVIINDYRTIIQTVCTSIAGLRHLEYLTVEAQGYYRGREMEFVLDCIRLNHLELRSIGLSYMEKLPSNLTYLYLEDFYLGDDPMPVLEKLRHLEVVRLKRGSVRQQRMVCSRGGFPKLQELELSVLNLGELVIEEGSMPLLCTLKVSLCERLDEIPDGLRFIDTLKLMSVDKVWEARLREGGEDYYKVQHIPTVKFI